MDETLHLDMAVSKALEMVNLGKKEQFDVRIHDLVKMRP